MLKTFLVVDNTAAVDVRWLIGFFLSVAPVVPGTVTELPSLRVLIGLVWGWRGLIRICAAGERSRRRWRQKPIVSGLCWVLSEQPMLTG